MKSLMTFHLEVEGEGTDISMCLVLLVLESSQLCQRELTPEVHISVSGEQMFCFWEESSTRCF